ncbi:undecaprenyl pyrophosphate synthetase [Phaeovulum vinaykumarii]|uniref:Isoprenyl transferase n=1 Tax=Phaeovulum vinaykumarii TaxID=407234 RepID=A0A1N7MUM2_9RHOB|nr:Undecaprenyl pyrophosphate synthetase [Phaeovulum vinaykumarii]SOC17025.1 undecaprenyl pyrophosphate synthetase [Phaeovulum vinaykumarii]
MTAGKTAGRDGAAAIAADDLPAPPCGGDVPADERAALLGAVSDLVTGDGSDDPAPCGEGPATPEEAAEAAARILAAGSGVPQGAGGAGAPRHVAIIMDGNGRWARERGWPRLVGHRRGAERVKQVVRACPDMGVEWLTIYAFSTENWRRSREEVVGLMGLFARYIRKEADELSKEGVRMRFIGDRSQLDRRLRDLMTGIEHRTAANTRLNLTVAINYGGRDEIVRAARRLAREVAAGRLAPDEIDFAALAAGLDTVGQPDPDLVIRTSGELRSSNFLPWQAAYSEYEFTPTLWPDFSPEELQQILARFAARERRFGGAKTR